MIFISCMFRRWCLTAGPIETWSDDMRPPNRSDVSARSLLWPFAAKLPICPAPGSPPPPVNLTGERCFFEPPVIAIPGGS